MLMLNFLNFVKTFKNNLVKFRLRLPGFTRYYCTILNSLFIVDVNATTRFHLKFYMFVTKIFSFISQSRRYQNLNSVTNGKKVFIALKKGFDYANYPLIIAQIFRSPTSNNK